MYPFEIDWILLRVSLCCEFELCAKRNLVPVFASKRVETKLELFPHPSSSIVSIVLVDHDYDPTTILRVRAT